LTEWRTSAIPKSTLIEITRIGDAAKQVEAWESAKNGSLTVRAAREKKSTGGGSRGSSGSPRHPADRALHTATTLVKSLRGLTEKESLPDPGILRNLQQASDEIAQLIRSLSEQHTQGETS
jgi:hypothetical protein